jgi:hypothetical protein
MLTGGVYALDALNQVCAAPAIHDSFNCVTVAPKAYHNCKTHFLQFLPIAEKCIFPNVHAAFLRFDLLRFLPVFGTKNAKQKRSHQGSDGGVPLS